VRGEVVADQPTIEVQGQGQGRVQGRVQGQVEQPGARSPSVPVPARRIRLPAAIVVGVLAVGVLVGVLVAGAGSGTTHVPAFGPLPRLGGGTPVALEPGRPTAITFFASWCSPCHTELPTVARVASQEAATGGKVAFLGIDGNDDPASGLAFARSSRVMFPVGEDVDSAVAPRFGLDGYPDTVFVDAAGDVAGIVRGPITAATLQGWLTRLSS